MSALKKTADVIPFNSEQAALNPHDIAAEEAILGGVLIDPNAIARIEDILSPGDFYLDAHRIVYAACLKIHREGNVIDLISLESALKDARQLTAIGGRIKMANLLNSTVSAANIDQHALLVLGKSRRRSLIAAGDAIARLGHNTGKTLPQVLDEAEAAVFAITQSVHSQTPADIGSELGEMLTLIEERHQGGELPGLSSGFYDIDSITQGFQRSDLVIAAGRPAMGKTSLMLQIGRNVAGLHGEPVLIFSLEMSKQQLLLRLLSAESQIESGRLRTGRVADHEWAQLSEGMAALGQLPLLIHDQPMITVGEIRSHARQTKATHGKLGAIIIDYLQLMGGGEENRVQELSRITRSLKGIARELNVPVIALSQLSRAVESRTNKRPGLSDLRESGAIEQDADVVMMLYREEYYDPDTPDRGIAEVIFAKHRSGPTGTVKLLFQPAFTKFYNRAHNTHE